MDTLHFSVRIRAPREKVWNVLWGDSTYRNWANVFSEGSYAISDWEQGSWIMFLTPAGDGVFSLIDRKVTNEMMSFRHMGILKGDMQIPEDEPAKKWLGAMENYRLMENNGMTELVVEMEASEDNRKYFSLTFPKALDQVRFLSEEYGMFS